MLDQLGQFFGQDRSREDDYRDFERRYREHPDPCLLYTSDAADE